MANSSTAFLRNNSKVPSFSSTIMNYKTIIKWEDIIKLYDVIVNPDWYDSIISKPEDWLASLTYYPFDIYSTNVNTPFLLKIGNHDTNIVTKFIDDVNNRYYNVGEYYVTPILNNFADYNGYSKIEIYLPYFGLTDVHPNDCLGKWLQFRLVVDYNSGQGTYFIGVSDNSITNGYDSEVRIISILTFQLGVQIPINSVGMADLKRNLTLGTVKAGMSIASSLITGAFIPADTTTTHHEAIYGRSKAKGSRMKMLQGEYDTTTTSNSHRAERTSVNTAFEYSVEALNNMKLSPTTDRVNNPLGLYVGSESIQIIRYIPKIVDVDYAYNHIYGRPLGEVKTLNEISGYTEVSRIHFENANFGGCTSSEYAMIEQLFTNGVILPEATVINFKVNTVDYKADKDMTWNEWISSAYNTDHFYSSIIKSGGVQYELVTIHNYEDNYIVVTYNGTPVTPNQLIIGDGVYGTTVLKKDVAGLYDENYTLIASWETLINTYGMDCEKDYTSSNYNTDTTSPYYILTNNNELTNGSKLIIDDSVNKIGDRAFYKCSSLTNVVIPDSVTDIGMYAFYICSSLENINIPNSVSRIDQFTFYNCSSLTSINIPDSVTSIGDGAFKLCTSLISLVIPDSVTSIGEQVCNECLSLTSVKISDSITVINDETFTNCSSLTQLSLPVSLRRIGRDAFRNCSSLSSVKIPNSLNHLFPSAFRGCTSLITIEILNPQTYFDWYAFEGCASLNKVVIGNSVKITKGTFLNCTSLENIIFNGTITQWNEVFKGEDWNSGVPATYIQCTDGQVNI